VAWLGRVWHGHGQYQIVNNTIGHKMSKTKALRVNEIADQVIDEAAETSITGDVDRYSVSERFAERLDDDSKSRFLVIACREYIDKRMRHRKRAIKPETARFQLVPAVDGTGARWARPLAKMTVYELVAKADQYDDLSRANKIVGNRYRELAELCLARGVDRPEELTDCDEVMARIFNPSNHDGDDVAA